jgi:hypothetical protein
LINTAFDPGSNAGDTYSNASDNLIIQLSFNNVNIDLLTASSSLNNESPYKDIANSPSVEEIFCVNINSGSFSRYNRTVKQFTPIAGSSGFVTNKIKVADSPIFIDDINGKRLYRSKSIVDPQKKRLQRGRNKVIVAASPTEMVNQNIIRNFGLENINAVLGAPTTLYTQFDKSLATLKRHYQQYYYIDVNTNEFIRAVSKIATVMDQVMDYFIPSKATLLNGILIEPNILEQVKIPPVKNIRTYGKGTRKTENAATSLNTLRPDYGATFNLSDTIDAIKTDIAKGSFDSYNSQLDGTDIITMMASFHRMTSSIDSNISLRGKIDRLDMEIALPEIETVGKVLTYKTQVDNIPTEIVGTISNLKTLIEDIVSEKASVLSDFKSYKTVVENASETLVVSSSVIMYGGANEFTGRNEPAKVNTGVDSLNKIAYNDVNLGSTGAEPYNRLYARKLYESEINTNRNGGNTSIYIPALYAIPPAADFNDYGVYTYFNNDSGIYYFPNIVKKPAYTRPLNAEWDMAAQGFVSVPTWSYGSRHNIYDVVYQEIDSSYVDDLGDIYKNARSGNGRYYVFKTRAAYVAPTDGTSFYSGSVPTYIPPSLDKVNWEVLRFTPIQTLVPKRVVFDTFTVANPELNNFKVTTVSVDRIVNEPTRYLDRVLLPTIQPNSNITGELSIQNIAILFALQTNISRIRVRLYRTPEQREADLSRSIETMPTGAHGVLIDTTLGTDNSTQIQNPFITAVSDYVPPNGKLYYTIDNLDGTVKLGGNLVVYYYAVELQARIPFGYLRKHYRYFRDTSTATKRRNFEGCKNTQETTIDGLPPIQIFLSEGSEVVVSSTVSNSEITTGGGGTLSVT